MGEFVRTKVSPEVWLSSCAKCHRVVAFGETVESLTVAEWEHQCATGTARGSGDRQRVRPGFVLVRAEPFVVRCVACQAALASPSAESKVAPGLNSGFTMKALSQ